MDDWLDRFTDALAQDHVGPQEMGTLLKLSRDVAHGVERRLAPLSTFVVGLHVGRRMAESAGRDVALREAIAAAARLLPEGVDEPGSEPA